MRTTEKEDYLAAAAEHGAAQEGWSALYTELQIARGNHDEVRALDLTGQLARANERVTLAKRILDLRAARARVKEREALSRVKREQVRAYASLASQLADQLALLMAIDQRLGIPFDSAGLGGIRIPAYGTLRADDTGALVSFARVHELVSAAAPRVEALLTEELSEKERDHAD